MIIKANKILKYLFTSIRELFFIHRLIFNLIRGSYLRDATLTNQIIKSRQLFLYCFVIKKKQTSDYTRLVGARSIPDYRNFRATIWRPTLRCKYSYLLVRIFFFKLVNFFFLYFSQFQVLISFDFFGVSNFLSAIDGGEVYLQFHNINIIHENQVHISSA